MQKTTSATVKNSRNDNNENGNFAHFEKEKWLEIVDFGGALWSDKNTEE